MKRTCLIVMSVLMAAAFSGCYLPFPNSFQLVEMTAGNTVSGFGIVGENLSSFEWSLDGDALAGQTKSYYLYAPGSGDIGMHSLNVKFYQDSIKKSCTWEIRVSEKEFKEDRKESEE